jgi:ubiquinone/menaquinone biosynthesis C-methylase UbiE
MYNGAMFNWYNKYVLPKRLDKAMGPESFNTVRSNVVNRVSGIVLEIGFGSGYNLPFYTGVDRLYALDPSSELVKFAQERIKKVSFPIEQIQSPAESIPLESDSVDSVVSTWSICSVTDPQKVLNEIYRVLKPGGKFYFVEHGKSEKSLYYFLQKIATPVTKLFTGNCHLDRKIDSYIIEAGFRFETIKVVPEDRRPLMYSYKGVAVK